MPRRNSDRFGGGVAAAVLLLGTVALTSPLSSQGPTPGQVVVLHVTDFGANQEWDAAMRPGDQFWPGQLHVFTPIDVRSQVLIPMPRDEQMKLSVTDLADQIAASLVRRVSERVRSGSSEFELQLVQNINTAGYLDPQRQSLVKKFGAATYMAIGQLTEHLKRESRAVSIDMTLGSNGTVAFTENSSAWSAYKNDIRHVDLIDGRAWTGATARSIEVVGAQKVRIVNTRGDWWAHSLSIANHDAVRSLMDRYEGLTGVLLEPLENTPAHISAMVNADERFRVLQLTRDGSGFRNVALGTRTFAELQRQTSVPDVAGTASTRNVSIRSETFEALAGDFERTADSLDLLRDGLELSDTLLGGLKGVSAVRRYFPAFSALSAELRDQAWKAREGGQSWQALYKLETAAREVVERLPEMINVLTQEGSLPRSAVRWPAQFGLTEFTAAGGSALGKGRMGVEEWTTFFDGVAKAAGATFAYAMTSRVPNMPAETKAEVASAVASAAGQMVSIGRAATWDLFREPFANPVRQQLVEQWTVAQNRRMTSGQQVQSLSEMFSGEDLRQLGFKPAMVKQLERNVAWMNATIQAERLTGDSSRWFFELKPSTSSSYLVKLGRESNSATLPVRMTAGPPIRNWWTSDSLSNPPGKSAVEVQMMTGMARDARRVLVAGAGPAARQMYDTMVQRVGANNTKWLSTFSSAADVQTQARAFGADTILGVRRETRPVAGTVSPAVRREPPSISRPTLPPPRTQPIVPVTPPCSPGSPRCGSGGAAAAGTGRIGGVMLDATAHLSNANGSPLSLASGDFSVLFEDAEAGMDFQQFRKFVTALWAVYFGKAGPGISIDPIAPGAEKQLVRYIGHVLYSDLARVMREADYQMKKWAVGSERPAIPGFQSVDRLTKDHGLRYLEAARRFWFVPEDMRFRLAGDALLFDSGKMTVKTEYITLNKSARAEPADEAFARAFTERYSEIAEKYPVYQELFEYAKLVSLARHIKERGAPLLWFLLANKDLVLTETSPGTVNALIKKSDYLDYVMIEGGVDLAKQPHQEHYVLDASALEALTKARRDSRQTDNQITSTVAVPTVTVAELNRDYLLRPSSLVVLGEGPSGGTRYQTDLALRRQGEPALELTRHYDPTIGPAEFGAGWRVMVPYRVEPASDVRIPFLNVRVPEKMRVENLITGKTETLAFNRTRYAVEGYVPSDPEASPLIVLVWMTNGSLRLIDKLGNEFQFEGSGRLTHVLISDDYSIEYLYKRERAHRQAFEKAPYRLRVDGEGREQIANATAPSRLIVTDERDGSEEVFVVDKSPSRRIAGWTPQMGVKSRYTFLALLSDASFLVEDRAENQIAFDLEGTFDYISTPVIQGLRQGDHRIEFDYEFHGERFRIRQAKVTRTGLSASLHSVRYDYSVDGRLASVTGPDGKVHDLHYESGNVWMTTRQNP